LAFDERWDQWYDRRDKSRDRDLRAAISPHFATVVIPQKILVEVDMQRAIRISTSTRTKSGIEAQRDQTTGIPANQ